MSGTLSPLEMYIDLCGVSKDRAVVGHFSSPFSRENKRIIIVDALTTRYSQRQENQIAKWRWYVQQTANAIPGNVGVFFPSYKIQRQVIEGITTKKHLLVETSKLNKEEKTEILKNKKN